LFPLRFCSFCLSGCRVTVLQRKPAGGHPQHNGEVRLLVKPLNLARHSALPLLRNNMIAKSKWPSFSSWSLGTGTSTSCRCLLMLQLRVSSCIANGQAAPKVIFQKRFLSSKQHPFETWNVRIDTRMNLLPHYIPSNCGGKNTKKQKIKNCKNAMKHSRTISAQRWAYQVPSFQSPQGSEVQAILEQPTLRWQHVHPIAARRSCIQATTLPPLCRRS
jgi:hypothetical protein